MGFFKNLKNKANQLINSNEDTSEIEEKNQIENHEEDEDIDNEIDFDETQIPVIQTVSQHKMIKSADEFKRLRLSEIQSEYDQAARDNASIEVWLDVIQKFPDLKEWVIHNKTIQIEILELLAKDFNPKVRACVANKRKINDLIFNLLKSDVSEDVRSSLLHNTKLSADKKSLIKTDDSTWLTELKKEILNVS